MGSCGFLRSQPQQQIKMCNCDNLLMVRFCFAITTFTTPIATVVRKPSGFQRHQSCLSHDWCFLMAEAHAAHKRRGYAQAWCVLRTHLFNRSSKKLAFKTIGCLTAPQHPLSREASYGCIVLQAPIHPFIAGDCLLDGQLLRLDSQLQESELVIRLDANSSLGGVLCDATQDLPS